MRQLHKYHDQNIDDDAIENVYIKNILTLNFISAKYFAIDTPLYVQFLTCVVTHDYKLAMTLIF